jgi:outer membrane protein OmpA-like peptidoglycan-associated protein
LYIGNIEVSQKNYEKGLPYLKKYLEFPNEKLKYVESAKRIIANAEFAIHALKNPVPFNPINLGPNINSEYDEYLPSLTTDEKTLVYTIQIPKKYYTPGLNDQFQEDFFYSKSVNGNWTYAQNMGKTVNTETNEGAQSISPDGRFLYFTACGRQDCIGECDLYYSKWLGTEWSKPMNMGRTVNTISFDSQPSVSSDGKTLYFASTRDGNQSPDIWVTIKDKNGVWGKPEKLGSEINTSGTEQFPFIHPDNTTLYFASNGFPGMGGSDIFMSKKDAKGNWTKAVNLGYPINTDGNEMSMIVNAAGNTAYFASNRDGGYGKQDIYAFELYDAVRPTKVTYLKGIVTDENTKVKLNAQFELIDLETKAVIVQSESDEKTGDFLVSLPTGKNYALNVSKEGYLFYSENFSLKETNNSEPYLMNVELKPIGVGETVILKNIFFETNSFKLKNESFAELEKLVDFLTKNSKLKIEISGHTDNTGNAELNQKLSTNRAKSVYDYLITKLIAKERLSFKGYADTQAIATNDTEEGKALNRRTEFKIVE